jgi:hypothetical protein
MTIKELSNELVRRIAAGEIDPNAVVVTPFCSCDEDVGYKEVQFVDGVRRMHTDTEAGTRIFHFGNSEHPKALPTVKLG